MASEGKTGTEAAETSVHLSRGRGDVPSGDSLAQVIGQLPRDQREAYLLHVEGQLSVGEIAEITESAIDTTQNAVRGARLRLRELLNEPT